VVGLSRSWFPSWFLPRQDHRQPVEVCDDALVDRLVEGEQPCLMRQQLADGDLVLTLLGKFRPVLRYALWDRTAYDLMTSVFPSVEEFNACGDAFKSFKEYMKAFNAANERAGLHEIEIAEDTDDVFVCHYKYCAWREVANEFGDPYLCYPLSCYSDEAWMPRFATEGGWKFKRTGTLATGAPVCDFRFERVVG
jgi:hypothetical protein